MTGGMTLKLTDEQLTQYYADKGIDRRDLLSTEPIQLDELPTEAQLDGPGRAMIERIVACWNGQSPLEKIDGAGAMERRALGRRSAGPAEAWCAFLLLGRVKGTDARRALMRQLALGKLTPADARRLSVARNAPTPRLLDVGMHHIGVVRPGVRGNKR